MITRILVPVDGSSTSIRGLEEAIGLVQQVGGTLRLLHSVDELLLSDVPLSPVDYDRWIEAIRERGQKIIREAQALCLKKSVDAEIVLAETMGRRAADVIIEQAKLWPADLIVMGTHGRRGVQRLLMGSDAELVLRTSAVPVLLVRERADSTWTPAAAA